MRQIEKTFEKWKNAPQDVCFSSLVAVCEHFFGAPRQKGTSHHVYKTPWLGDPRVNIQKGKSGKAKAYQVKQVLTAIRKLEGHDNG